MSDGLELRADIYRPLEDGQYPALLSCGPYAKGLKFQDAYADRWRLLIAAHPEVMDGSSNEFQNWEVVDPEKWVPFGYVCVRVDSRGAGRSPGFLDCWSPRETRDLYECVEWVAAQSWSNGRVGLAGISYYAINQWHAAALQPPHLAAICPWEGAADHYRDICYHGGILSTFGARFYPEQITNVQHGVGQRGPRSGFNRELVAGPETYAEETLAENRVELGEQIRSHPLDDEFHQSRSADWQSVTVPLLSCANWGGQGLHARGNFEGFTRAASAEKWLECHGLEHWTHFYTDYGVELQRRFFDHFLRGVDSGWESQPRVLLQVRHVGDQFRERRESEWPLARTTWTRVYLDAQSRELRRDCPVAGAFVSYGGLDEGITFSTPPLEEETEVTGPLAAKLFVSSETTDADLFVVFRIFDPRGQEVTFRGANDLHSPASQGWLRASHRKLERELTREWHPYHTHDELQPLARNTVYELDIEIWPTCIVVPAGYRIALTVQGKDYDYGGPPIKVGWLVMRGCGPFLHDDPRDRPPNVFGGKVTLHTGPETPSYLLLPIIRT